MAKIAPSVIVITTFSLVLLTGFWLVIMPQIKLLTSEQQSALVTANSSLSLRSTKKAVSAADLINQKSTRDQVLALIPLTDDQYNFTTQIESLSKNLGIPLASYSTAATVVTPVAKPVTDDGSSGGSAPKPVASTTAPASAPASAPAAVVELKKLTASMSISASYLDVQKFIMAVQQLDRYVQISQIVMTGSQASDQVTATFTASAYYLPKS